MEVKCTKCDSWFRSVSTLNRHFREQHQRNRAIFHTCQYCEKQFLRRSTLSVHIQSLHTKPSTPVEKKFQCSTCKKGFDKIFIFERHLSLCEKTLKLDSFSCYYCGKVFSKKNSIKWHIIRKHRNQDGCALCDICGAKFRGMSAKTALEQHVREYHLDNNSAGKFKCALCIKTFATRENIQNHLIEKHDISILHEHLNFPSGDQFQEWKKNLEKSTFTSFCCRTGLRHYKNHSACTFTCHRSGNFQPKTEGRKRKIRHQGTKKTGSYCPAEINLRVNKPDGTCRVSFTNMHLGHNVCDKNELLYICVPPEERAAIASQIASGLSYDKILMDHSLDKKDQVYTLTRKHLHNITKKFGLKTHSDFGNVEIIDSSKAETIKPFERFDSEFSEEVDTEYSIDVDTESSEDVDMKSIKLEGVEFSKNAYIEVFLEQHRKSILFLKKSGETSSSNILRKKDFFMVMMTEKQKDVLLKYGSKVISVDATFTLTNCDFLFFTLLTIDDHHVGVPVAFAISSQRDFNVVELFLSCIHKKTGVLSTELFMSDVEFDYYRHWREIMGVAENQPFCRWNGAETWRRKLRKISPSIDHTYMADRLYKIITKPDKRSFYSSINEFFAITDSKLAHILGILKRLHVEEIEKWAKCCRETAEVNVKMLVESLNQRLRYFYEKLANTKSLSSLLAVIDDYLLTVSYNYRSLDEFESSKGKAEDTLSSKLRDLRRLHDECEKYGVIVNVESTTDGMWFVSVTDSDSDFADVHLVSECHDSCLGCRLVCEKCDTCAQRYRCSCVDNATENRMCKHIHALGMNLNLQSMKMSANEKKRRL